ncbi:hypothetical protein D3C76_954560 [compost metagenome]
MGGRCLARGVAHGKHDSRFARGIRRLLLLQDFDLFGNVAVGPGGGLGGEQGKKDDGQGFHGGLLLDG